MVDDTSPTAPIRKYQPVRRASIVPVSSAAPEAPVMVAPGAPTMESPVSQASREREARVRKQFEDIEAQYGRHRDVRSRRAEMRMSEAPETPVTDAYAIQMRPRLPVAGVPLEPLVIAKEQRKREEWISAEAYRAATLPGELQYDIQVAAYHRQLAEYNRQMSECHKAVAEQRALDAEAHKYGHATYESLMQAIQEEKLIKRLNELGGVLTDVQLEAQRAAREGVSHADYADTLASQRAEIERIQRSLQTSFGIETRAGTDYVADVQAVMGARDVEPVTMRTMAAPAPAAPYQVTIFPDLKLTTDTVPPYREPVPSDPIEQIFYHHAPIFDSLRRDLTIGDKPVAPKYGTDPAYRMLTYPVASAIHEPLAPLYRPVEMVLEMGAALAKLPGATTHYVTHPGDIPEIPGKLAAGLIAGYDRSPFYFAIDTAVLAGAAKVGQVAAAPITTPLTAGITEAGIILRTAPAMRPFVKGASRIGRYSEGMKIPTATAPRLDAARNVGKASDIIGEVIASERGVYYGSIIETGQMPGITSLQRTGRKYTPSPSDVDVFVADPARTASRMMERLGPGYGREGVTITRKLPDGTTAHAVDIHSYPPGYPGAPRGTVQVVPAGSEVVQAPRLPFDFMPKELLEVGGTTQEHLYTQVQRKATSIIGQPKGIFGWEAGPPAHRLKDVASTLIEADYLIAEGTRQLATMPAGIRKMLLTRQVRKLGEGYDLIAGTDIGKMSLDLARGLDTGVGGLRFVTGPPLLLTPSPARTSPVYAGTVAGMGLVSGVSPTVRRVSSPVISPVASPRASSPAVSPIVSPAVSSPFIRSPTVARVSPIVATPSPGIGSPLIRRVTSPTVTSPTVARVSPIVRVSSPVVGSPGIRRVASPTATSPAVSVGSPTVVSPDIGLGSPITRRPRRVPGEDETRHRYPWEEWFISYRDAPTPHKGFEGVYLGLPDVARPGPVTIKGLQRVTVGPAPVRKVRPKVARGKAVQVSRPKRDRGKVIPVLRSFVR